MTKHSITAEKRVLKGRKLKNLRNQGILHANIYGSKTKSLSVQVKEKDFEKVFADAGETGLVELLVESEKRPVLIHNVQKHPLTDSILHVDFLQVDLKQKVTAQVPIALINESPVEKQGLGTVVQYLDEIEVEALPADLPEKFELDLLTPTEINQVIQVKDIKIDKNKVEIQEGDEEIIVKAEPPKEEKEEIAPVETAEGETSETESSPEGEKTGDETSEPEKS